MSNLSEFLTENDLTPEQVVSQSRVLEAFSRADREILNRRATARRAKKSYEEAGVDKPRAMGRGVSLRIVRLALEGKPLTSGSRRKIVRAVNSLLAAQSKGEVEGRALFGDVRRRKGKSPS